MQLPQPKYTPERTCSQVCYKTCMQLYRLVLKDINNKSVYLGTCLRAHKTVNEEDIEKQICEYLNNIAGRLNQ